MARPKKTSLAATPPEKIDPVAVVKEAFGENFSRVVNHPLFTPLSAAILQATSGKGERHGGDATPFFDQLWLRVADTHGSGFLTGQAAKKLDEAVASHEPGTEGYRRELLGAIVYIGMALLFDDESEPEKSGE